MIGGANRRRAALLAPGMLIILALIGVPLIIVTWVSFLGRGETSGVDWHAVPTGANYLKLFMEEDFDGSLIYTPGYAIIFLRSVMQAAVTTLICFALGLPVALWMAGLSRFGRDVMVLLITIPFWTNLLVRTYAWILLLRNGGLVDAGLQGVGLTEQPLGLLYTDTAVIIGLLYCFLPFMVLPIYTSLEKLDWRLVEAAFDLGANRFQALKRIIIPLSMPGIIAGVMLVFIPSLGNYIIPELLGGGKSLMIGNLIQLQFGSGHNWPLGAALAFSLFSLVLLALLFNGLRQRGQEVRG